MEEKKKKRINSYRKGYDFERKIVNGARASGLVSFRSAGSHSPVDVVIIDEFNREIILIQCKSTKRKYKNKGEYLEKDEANYVVKWRLMNKD